ncbi:hypothetical protein [Bradyrhizobium liaoningense]
MEMISGGVILGAVRSAHFLLTKLWRQIFPRAQVEAVPLLRSHVEIGHDILLINTSDEPILIYSFDIIDAAKKGDNEKNFNWVFHLEDNLVEIRLEPKQSYKLNFNEGDWFPMEPSKGRYFLRLWLAGTQDPIWIDIT